MANHEHSTAGLDGEDERAIVEEIVNDEGLDTEEPNSPEPTWLPPFPHEIQLDFQLLELEELEQAAIKSSWTYVHTWSFGRIDDRPLELAIYQEEAERANSQPDYYAVMALDGSEYLIPHVSSELARPNGEANTCPGLCLIERQLPGQDRYSLIGTVEMFANGPGLNRFVIYDRELASWVYFDQWGDPDFLDLDGDGIDEFLIQLPGLHLQWPDISIVRVESGQLEQSAPIMDLYERAPGDYASFVKEAVPPLIRLGHVWNEEERAYDYHYEQGKLLLDEAVVVE